MKEILIESEKGQFSITIPEEWDEYDSEQPNTWAFFNSSNWTGNLRITPLHWAPEVFITKESASRLFESELAQNINSKILRLADKDCVHYRNKYEQDGEFGAIYYWIIKDEEKLFTCSFSLDLSMENEFCNSEREVVSRILTSIY